MKRPDRKEQRPFSQPSLMTRPPNALSGAFINPNNWNEVRDSPVKQPSYKSTTDNDRPQQQSPLLPDRADLSLKPKAKKSHQRINKRIRFNIYSSDDEAFESTRHYRESKSTAGHSTKHQNKFETEQQVKPSSAKPSTAKSNGAGATSAATSAATTGHGIKSALRAPSYFGPGGPGYKNLASVCLTDPSKVKPDSAKQRNKLETEQQVKPNSAKPSTVKSNEAGATSAATTGHGIKNALRAPSYFGPGGPGYKNLTSTTGHGIKSALRAPSYFGPRGPGYLKKNLASVCLTDLSKVKPPLCVTFAQDPPSYKMSRASLNDQVSGDTEYEAGASGSEDLKPNLTMKKGSGRGRRGGGKMAIREKGNKKDDSSSNSGTTDAKSSGKPAESSGPDESSDSEDSSSPGVLTPDDSSDEESEEVSGPATSSGAAESSSAAESSNVAESSNAAESSEAKSSSVETSGAESSAAKSSSVETSGAESSGAKSSSVETSSAETSSAAESTDAKSTDVEESAGANTKGHIWTMSQDAMIRAMKAGGEPWAQIGQMLGFSKTEVQKRWKELEEMDGTLAKTKAGKNTRTGETTITSKETIAGNTTANGKKGKVSQMTASTKKTAEAVKQKPMAGEKGMQATEKKTRAAEKTQATEKKTQATEKKTQATGKTKAGGPTDTGSNDNDMKNNTKLPGMVPIPTSPLPWPCGYMTGRTTEARRTNQLYAELLEARYPAPNTPAPDGSFSQRDVRVLGALNAKYKVDRWLEMQASFFNVTGRMVPAEVLRSKMEEGTTKEE